MATTFNPETLLSLLFPRPEARVPNPMTGTPGPAFQLPLGPEDELMRQIIEMVSTPEQVQPIEPPREVSRGDRILAAITDAIGGLAGRGPAAGPMLRERGQERREIEGLNQARTEEAKRRAQGNLIQAVTGVLGQRQGEAAEESRFRRGEQAKIDAEKRRRQEEIDDRVETIEAGAKQFGIDLSGFDLGTREGRGEAMGVINRAAAEAEMRAQDNAQNREEMRGALAIAEAEAATLVNTIAFGDPTTNVPGFMGREGRDATVKRRAVQQEFRVRLEQQIAVLRGAGYSEQFIKNWVNSKQARLESILQGMQAEAVTGGKRTPPPPEDPNAPRRSDFRFPTREELWPPPGESIAADRMRSIASLLQSLFSGGVPPPTGPGRGISGSR